ncbi:hypothetical protein VTK73DRAFT_5469 [Phialemonium thermophilum]|uniref:Major facilitator superfamily (MFS) profile domain-containing protein n=1 Tax=Phialemonium thermophilum TaxID=223376 RepID=A0ABR3V1S0_9PEZI
MPPQKARLRGQTPEAGLLAYLSIRAWRLGLPLAACLGIVQLHPLCVCRLSLPYLAMTLDAEDIETSRKNTTTTTTDSPAREHVAGTDAPTAAAAAGSGAAAPDEPGVAAGDSEKRQEENHQQQQQQQQEQEETRSSTRDNTAHELPTGEPPSEAPVASTSHEDGQPAAANAVPPRYSVYGPWEKRLIVLGAALSAFFSPLTAQIYLPALPQLSEDFHVSASKMNLTVTTYMIFQGVTPMLIGGFADAAGRRPAFVLCFVIYVAANIGLALSDSFGALLGVRCLHSSASPCCPSCWPPAWGPCWAAC